MIDIWIFLPWYLFGAGSACLGLYVVGVEPIERKDFLLYGVGPGLVGLLWVLMVTT